MCVLVVHKSFGGLCLVWWVNFELPENVTYWDMTVYGAVAIGQSHSSQRMGDVSTYICELIDYSVNPCTSLMVFG